MAFRYFVFIILIVGCSNEKPTTQNANFQKAIKQHLDASIAVYDQYAIVKLPLNHGPRVWNPGALEVRSDNTIFVANMTGEIYSLHDSNGDGLEDEAVLYCDVKDDGFRTPTGMVFKGQDLFVGLPQQIRVYRDLDHDNVADTSFSFFDKIPFSDHPYEYTTGLKFDKEGWLYFTLTTDSWNVGASPDPLKFRGSILKVSSDGKTVKTVATGIRSVFGMDFDKEGNLFFSDNQGGQNKYEELHILKEGRFYGHNTDKYGNSDVQEEIGKLDYEVAPAEMQFHIDNEDEYLFVAYYGPGEYWERGAVTKIEVNQVSRDSFNIQEFPIADIPKSAGLVVSKNGDIYVSSVGKTDYWYFAKDTVDGAIYRLIKQNWIKPQKLQSKAPISENFVQGSLETGKFIFSQRACGSCHSIDGKSNLLGPDLKNISSIYNRKELIEEIKNPSKRLKPGDFPTKITTMDNETYLGRVKSQNEKEVKLILVGNLIKTIPTSNIKSSEQLAQSLMYTGLLNGLSDKEVNSLLDYLYSLKDE